MKQEYYEGPMALEKFNKGMANLFHASKEAVKDKPKPKAKRKKASKD